jgi:hypothetical protein
MARNFGDIPVNDLITAEDVEYTGSATPGLMAANVEEALDELHSQLVDVADGYWDFLYVRSVAAAGVPVTVQGAVSQTANLMEWKYSSGEVVLKVDYLGRVTQTTLAPSFTLAPLLGTDAYVQSSGGELHIRTIGDYDLKLGRNSIMKFSVTSGGARTVGQHVFYQGDMSLPSVVAGVQTAHFGNIIEYQDHGVMPHVVKGYVSASGGLGVPVGAVDSPSVAFVDDTDTGMWSSVADVIDFSVGGVKVVTVSSVGVVSPGDFESTNDSKGFVFRSPNGSRWRATVGDDGTLSTAPI